MIQFSPEFKTLFPRLRLGLIQAKVTVEPSSSDLLQEIAHFVQGAPDSFEQIKENPRIAASRQAYKKLGKDPSRYRLSAEALHRRLVKAKGLYQINNVVDLLNLSSLQSGFSIGGYDQAQIEGQITLKRGHTEAYQALGRGSLNIEHLPVLYDQQGPFGSPTSDSQRTAISPSTNKVLWVFFDFDSDPSLEEQLKTAKHQLKKYAQSTESDLKIIQVSEDQNRVP